METQTQPQKTQTPGNGEHQPTPSQIMQIGLGFWASKTLLAAIKFRLFTLLAEKPMSASEIKSVLKLNCSDRNAWDFLDTLVAFGFLNRKGLMSEAVYSNGLDTDVFLDKNKPTYIGGILEMANNRLYKFWGDLEEGLRTGEPQNESKYSKSGDQFTDFYKDERAMIEFLNAMAGVQMGNFIAFSRKFDFSKYKTLCDAGGASGMLSIQVAFNQPHMQCITFDLPAVEKVVNGTITGANLSDRVKAVSGDFMKDPLPKADVITMGNILHDWDEEKKNNADQKSV